MIAWSLGHMDITKWISFLETLCQAFTAAAFSCWTCMCVCVCLSAFSFFFRKWIAALLSWHQVFDLKDEELPISVTWEDLGLLWQDLQDHYLSAIWLSVSVKYIPIFPSQFIVIPQSAVTSSINNSDTLPLAVLHAHVMILLPTRLTDNFMIFWQFYDNFMTILWAVNFLLNTFFLAEFWCKFILVSSVQRVLFKNWAWSF